MTGSSKGVATTASEVVASAARRTAAAGPKGRVRIAEAKVSSSIACKRKGQGRWAAGSPAWA
eukprot:2041472-Alexandrium_andersonii.AAC.1